MKSQNQTKKFEEIRILKPSNFALVLEEMKTTFHNHALIPCESFKCKEEEESVNHSNAKKNKEVERRGSVLIAKRAETIIM